MHKYLREPRTASETHHEREIGTPKNTLLSTLYNKHSIRHVACVDDTISSSGIREPVVVSSATEIHTGREREREREISYAFNICLFKILFGFKIYVDLLRVKSIVDLPSFFRDLSSHCIGKFLVEWSGGIL
jgi:hypothetical protein